MSHKEAFSYTNHNDITELVELARMKYAFKFNQLIKGLGRKPTNDEMEEVASVEIGVILMGNGMLRGKSPQIPESLLVQINMTRLRP